MIVQIDNNTESLYYDQISQLEGIEYLFRFLWAPRSASMYLGIYDQDANPIALSIRLVVNVNLLRRFKFTPLIPPGRLILVDSTGQDAEITAAGDLYSRHFLYYVTSDDPLITGAA